jgi:UDP-N-acetylglucosamine--N-acetylmuramyl-(pentapeptide) pyrophosphoryl-undecaprenol N-acetylglucosamine transferase
LAASLSGIPTAVAEQNARPGLTNRILGRWVRRVYTAFPEAESYFPVRKVRMLGNPVRSAFEPSEMTDLTQTRRILILGGSQGARSINETMPHVLAAVAKRYDAFEVLHQSGKGRDSLVRAAYDACGLSQVRVSAFIDDMAQEVSNAHLVIGRSGATTVAELAAVGRPAYFIPFPFAADDHQAANASSLVDCGAARMIREAQIDVETWAEELALLLADASRLKTMGDEARSRGVPESADQIVKDLLSLTSKGKGGLS